MRKSLGEKRKRISEKGISDIVQLYGDFEENDRVKILPNESFGAMRITIERPPAPALGSNRSVTGRGFGRPQALQAGRRDA